jgi:outer membrane biosynthesis protein TonB
MKNILNFKTHGIIGTILFHIVIFMLLIFLALRIPVSAPGKEGMMVNFGFDNTGMGFDQQLEPAPAMTYQEPASVPEKIKEEEEEILTQDNEEAPAIEKKKEEPVKKEVPKVKPKPEPEPKKEVPKSEPVPVEPKPEPQPQVDQKSMYKGKSTTSTQGGQEGITGQPGDQGNPNGFAGVPNYTGKGGLGNEGDGTGVDGANGEGNGPGGTGSGISFNLGGRGSLKLPKPSYDSQQEGKVVVTIKVDRNGNVISALPGAKGTNVSDQTLWNLAKSAALQSKFAADPDAPDFQVGTITYSFIRQN